MSIRRVAAALLVVLAVVWVLVDKSVVAEGPTLLVLTRDHGVTVSDLLSVVLVLAAVALLVPRRRAPRRR